MSRLWQVFAGNRAAAVMLTVLMHILALLFVTPWEPGPRREPSPLEPLQGVWIRLDPLPPPPAPSEPESGSEETPPPREAPRSAVRVQPRAVPPTAITLPPATDEKTPASDTPRPGVDWYEAAAKLGGNYGAEKAPDTLIPPRERMREPCKPPKRSFKWNHEDETSSKGGIAALTMGWEEPPPDKHFFDDMKQGKTPHSSVPDPNVCD
jgi:hypothetical protein